MKVMVVVPEAVMVGALVVVEAVMVEKRCCPSVKAERSEDLHSLFGVLQMMDWRNGASAPQHRVWLFSIGVASVFGASCSSYSITKVLVLQLSIVLKVLASVFRSSSLLLWFIQQVVSRAKFFVSLKIVARLGVENETVSVSNWFLGVAGY
ncbi:hypothetical protein Tco_0832394 [Tanacetum coccineum]